MIKVICLVENTCHIERLNPKHGLSIYIETKNHKVLFDVGPDDLYFENANKIGIDIAKVDTVVISHGHDDHGGGLKHFLEHNKIAKVYIREEAFINHFSGTQESNKYIGLDKSIINNDRLVYTTDYLKIDDELEIFSNITERKLYSRMNNALFMDKHHILENDDFMHEQYLIVNDHNSGVLFTGCSHNGIVNILEKCDTIKHKDIKYVFGGFHLYNPRRDVYETDDRILEVADYLLSRQEYFYTCHCTGIKAYELMSKKLGNKLSYLSVGNQLDIIDIPKDKIEY